MYIVRGFYSRSFLPLVLAQLLIQFDVQPIVNQPTNSNLTASNGSAVNEIHTNEPFINRNVRSVPAHDDLFDGSALNGTYFNKPTNVPLNMCIDNIFALHYIKPMIV